MKRKLLAILMGTVMIFSLAACSQNDSEGETEESTEEVAEEETESEEQETETVSADYPKNTIQLIVPSSAGGSTDLTARILAQYASEILGQQVIVTNVTGSNGVIGNEQVLNADPDGYTICFHHNALITNNLSGLTTLKYDDFAVGPNFCSDDAVGIFTSSEYPDAESFIAAAKEHPGELSICSSTGGYAQLIENAFVKAAGVETVHTDLGDNAEQTAGLLGGHVNATTGLFGTNKSYIESGDMTMIGVCSEERLETCPDVPTFKEQGIDCVLPGYQFSIFYPKDTPQEIMDIFNDAVKQVTENENAQKDLLEIGAVANYRSAEDNRVYWKDMDAQFGELWQ
ncbi:MAG: tripartite tricarboxylate transporter substrate binding protein [Lachnospiraceae bacterium]|jgi:tripartite-type tricarboxylate transporter receptor subunit TctC